MSAAYGTESQLCIEVAILQKDIKSTNPKPAPFSIPSLMTEQYKGAKYVNNYNVINKNKTSTPSVSTVTIDNQVILDVPKEYTKWYGASIVPKGTKFIVAFISGDINSMKIIGRYDSSVSDDLEDYELPAATKDAIGDVKIGDTSHRTAIYGSTVCLNGTSTAVTSDARLKKEFEDFDERYEKLFMDLKPQLFKYKDSSSNRKHSGFIAQDVKDALDQNDINTKDFAAYMEDKADLLYMEEAFGENAPLKSDDTQLYLRYEEFIALNTHMIQKLYNRIDKLETEIAELKKNK